MKLIALVDHNWGIAKNGRQICFIPDDLARFKSLTTGGDIVLGSKTLLSFPRKKPLPGRRNYILSKKLEEIDGAVICRNISDIPEKVLKNGWCVGGESVYRQCLPYCDHAYITAVDEDLDADQFFPNLDKNEEWEKTEESSNIGFGFRRYRFLEYRRK